MKCRNDNPDKFGQRNVFPFLNDLSENAIKKFGFLIRKHVFWTDFEGKTFTTQTECRNVNGAVF